MCQEGLAKTASAQTSVAANDNVQKTGGAIRPQKTGSMQALTAKNVTPFISCGSAIRVRNRFLTTCQRTGPILRLLIFFSNALLHGRNLNFSSVVLQGEEEKKKEGEEKLLCVNHEFSKCAHR